MDERPDLIPAEDASELARRLGGEWPLAEAEPSVLAAALDKPEAAVRAEWEILLGERKLQELEQERAATELRLREARAARPAEPEPETPEPAKQAWLERQEAMYAWNRRGDIEDEPPPKPRSVFSPLVTIAFVLFLAFFLMQTCASALSRVPGPGPSVPAPR